jgi:hypothetical protein
VRVLYHSKIAVGCNIILFAVLSIDMQCNIRGTQPAAYEQFLSGQRKVFKIQYLLKKKFENNQTFNKNEKPSGIKFIIFVYGIVLTPDSRILCPVYLPKSFFFSETEQYAVNSAYLLHF